MFYLCTLFFGIRDTGCFCLLTTDIWNIWIFQINFISDKRNSDAVFVSTGRDCVFVYVFSMFKMSEQRAGGLNGSVFTQEIF